MADPYDICIALFASDLLDTLYAPAGESVVSAFTTGTRYETRRQFLGFATLGSITL
jgi:hypothetical protein